MLQIVNMRVGVNRRIIALIVTKDSGNIHIHRHQLDTLSFGCRCLRLETLESVVQHVSTLLFVQWDTASKVPTINVNIQNARIRPF